MPLPIPPGHHTITPGAVVKDAAAFLSFLEDAFGFALVEKYDTPDGHVAHAEMRSGDSVFMFGESMGGFEPTRSMWSLYVDDVDAAYARALAAGATSISAPANQFYGHRSARVADAFGNKWALTAVVEEVSAEEIARRMAAMMGG